MCTYLCYGEEKNLKFIYGRKQVSRCCESPRPDSATTEVFHQLVTTSDGEDTVKANARAAHRATEYHLLYVTQLLMT